jgi:hypothetical protein
MTPPATGPAARPQLADRETVEIAVHDLARGVPLPKLAEALGVTQDSLDAFARHFGWPVSLKKLRSASRSIIAGSSELVLATVPDLICTTPRPEPAPAEPEAPAAPAAVVTDSPEQPTSPTTSQEDDVSSRRTTRTSPRPTTGTSHDVAASPEPEPVTPRDRTDDAEVETGECDGGMHCPAAVHDTSCDVAVQQNLDGGPTTITYADDDSAQAGVPAGAICGDEAVLDAVREVLATPPESAPETEPAPSVATSTAARDEAADRALDAAQDRIARTGTDTTGAGPVRIDPDLADAHAVAQLLDVPRHHATLRMPLGRLIDADGRQTVLGYAVVDVDLDRDGVLAALEGTNVGAVPVTWAVRSEITPDGEAAIRALTAMLPSGTGGAW